MQTEDCYHEPLVSVIIPTYNRLGYLKEALQSAVQQTYRHIEIIVSDNASAESPQALIESFNDSRIRLYRQTENVGMFANVQSAFLRATGKYVASLLDDDRWEPEFLSKLVPPLESNQDLAIAFCDHSIMTETGEIDPIATAACSRRNNRDTLPAGIYPPPITTLGLVSGAISSAMAAVIRREVVDWSQIPLEADVLWDVYVTYCCCVSGLGAYYCPEKLTCVREHSNSETQKGGRNVQAKIRKGRAQIFCYGMLMQDDRLRSHHSYFQTRWVQANTTLGIGLLRDRNPKEARFFLWRSLQTQIHFRTLAAWLISYLPSDLAYRF